MKIGVLSDTHGSVLAWKQAIYGPLKDVDLIIHAGDVLYHGPRNPLPEQYKPADLAAEINDSKVPVLIAKGNCDSEVDQMVIDLPMQAPYVLTEQPIGRILVSHGHQETTNIETLAEKYKIDIWITGHTHIPVLEKRAKTIFLNPGSVSLPKGDMPNASCAVIKQKTIELISLRDNNVYQTLAR